MTVYVFLLLTLISCLGLLSDGLQRTDGGWGMSVIVKMEMPKVCMHCDASYDFMACSINGEAWYNNKRYPHFNPDISRLPNCPIIGELPEKHGRLVDADALHKIAGPVIGYTGRIVECVQMRNLYKAPTIVPAERIET